MKRWCLSICLIVPLLMSACAGGTPAEPPAVSPVVPASPSPLVSPTPSEDPLHAEAARVFLGFVELQESYDLTGNYDEFPEEMSDYLSPEYLKDIEILFWLARDEGWVHVGEVPEHVTVPAPGVSKDGSEVTLRTCSDARGLTLYSRDGVEIRQGVVTQGYFFFKYSDGALKIFESDLWEAKSCDIA